MEKSGGEREGWERGVEWVEAGRDKQLDSGEGNGTEGGDGAGGGREAEEGKVTWKAFEVEESSRSTRQ